MKITKSLKSLKSLKFGETFMGMTAEPKIQNGTMELEVAGR